MKVYLARRWPVFRIFHFGTHFQPSWRWTMEQIKSCDWLQGVPWPESDRNYRSGLVTSTRFFRSFFLQLLAILNLDPSQATLYNVLVCFSVHRAVVSLICQGVTFLFIKKLTWKTCFSGKICYRSAPLILNKPAADKSLTPTRLDNDQADISTSPKLLHAEVGPSYASESDENEKPHQENICVPSKDQPSVSYF